jgi:hypothetical protein
MRFLARCLTGLGLVALGADGLIFLERGTRTPYTLDWAMSRIGGNDQPVTAAVATQGDAMGGVPVSLICLWLGAVLFVLARRTRSQSRQPG